MNTLARKLKDGGRATELKIFNEEELSAALSVYGPSAIAPWRVA